MRVAHRESRELRHQRPVAADRALDQALVREPVQAAVLAVARRRGEHQRQLLRARRLAEPPLERAISSSGVPLPTKPETATVSPSRTMASASSADTILFFTRSAFG